MVRSPRALTVLCQLLLLAGLWPAAAPGADEVQWLFRSPRQMVASTNQLGQISADDSAWRAVIDTAGDPFLVLRPLEIDADRNKTLCLRLALASGSALQVFFSPPGQAAAEARSFRVRDLTGNAAPAVFVIDLAGVPRWQGMIAQLRIDIDGAKVGTTVALVDVGVAPPNVVLPEGIVRVAEEADAISPLDCRRSAAWQDTIVGCLMRQGNAGVMTYIKDRFAYGELYHLAKFVVKIEKDGRLVDARRLPRVPVDDLPGGAQAHYELDGVQITTEILALPVGRDTAAQDGAALFTVRTDPPSVVVVDCGHGALESPFTGQCPMNDSTMNAVRDRVLIEGGLALITSPAQPLHVALVSPASPVRQANATGGQYVRYRFPDGHGQVMLAYADEPKRMKEIAAFEPDAVRKQLDDYYAKLFECRVRTPVQDLDDAFRGALTTLDYAWNSPFGWVESINHWFALWHMQATAGAEWLGQADRSRLCNLTHADNLMPDGAVPQMMPYVHTRRDFGGSDQFFCWQVRHYFQFTNDLDFARRLAPVIDRVIAHAYAENDTDHNRLLGWGLQIGNQEDYVATPHDGTTPSIEGLNMFRTRRELALALADRDTVARCEAEMARICGLIRERLWQADLGRAIYWRDPLGVAHLDGQYHSLLYPVIWDLVDPLDAWTTLRHVHDRLQGANGAVFCSNNFPNHVGGTWGMQAGAAQQPWAAWGFAAAGQRNETWRPLAATAAWVMDENHRGAWPEVAAEPNAAYFSPPAGLFVTAMAEALFGLKVRKPDGRLEVSPSFPDDWPAASLELPEYRAEYRRQGHRVDYTVQSRDELARYVRWSLPPCRLQSVEVDGTPVEYRVEPGVNCVFVCLETPRTRASRVTIVYEPLPYAVTAPKSVAEGDTITVEVRGFAAAQIDDRGGLLERCERTGDTRFAVRLRTGLLAPYQPYGRLGQLTFSRRSLFFYCQSAAGTPCWLPVDVAVLPRYEAAPVGELALDGSAVAARVRLRNNTATTLKGTAWLRLGECMSAAPVEVSARSEAEATFRLPANRVSRLSGGDNRALLTLPGDAVLELTLTATKLLTTPGPLARYQSSRLRPIELPAADLIADTQWPTLRSFKAYPHTPWAGSRPPLEALGDRGEIAVPELGGLTFRFQPRRFLPVSYPVGRPSWTLPLNGQPYRKVYLLVIPFLDNHDLYSPVAQISVHGENDAVFARSLYFPGDVDWWSAPAIVGDFATARQGRPDRFGLLALLRPDQGDWAEGRPPTFPQPEFWASCLPVTVASSVMNVIELDLGQTMPLKSLTFAAIGVQPGFGLVSMIGETAGDTALLDGTAWMPPAELREPRLLFAFNAPEDIRDWTVAGAFSVAAVPALFAYATLNSLASGGETATGRALSPTFAVGQADRFLDVELQGGSSERLDGRNTLCLRLLDAESGKTLQEAMPPGSPKPTLARLSLEGLQGKTLRLEISDENTKPSFAWIGVKSAVIGTRTASWTSR